MEQRNDTELKEKEEVDALFWKKKNKESEEKTPNEAAIPKIPHPHDDFYKMDHQNRGLALIFNHYKFDDKELDPREGTDKDQKALEKVLKYLNFEIEVYNDKNYADIFKILKRASEKDHSNNDCLAVFMMTHGETNVLHAKDVPYPVDKLWHYFTAKNCKTLAGKPKMFFIQACRGSLVDKGEKVEFDGSPNANSVAIPNMADILIMYSAQEDTNPGHFSFRNGFGSWLMQTLSNELKKRAKNQDLLSILTFVNRTIAFQYTAFNPLIKAINEGKQVPQVVYTFTKLLYFFPENTSK